MVALLQVKLAIIAQIHTVTAAGYQEMGKAARYGYCDEMSARVFGSVVRV